MPHEIVERMSKLCHYDEPCACYISGGLDSTIVLHHLVENGMAVKAFTASFDERTLIEDMKIINRLSSHYKVITEIIWIKDIIPEFPEIQRHLPQPRYNVWPWWLARAVHADGFKTAFVGEGADEIFGGYNDRSYLEAWASQIEYIRRTWDVLHAVHDVKIVAPFSELNSFKMANYFHPPNKQFLRDAYRGILPDFVIDRPAEPPHYANYRSLWERELKNYFPPCEDISVVEIKRLLQLFVTRVWLNVHEIMELERSNSAFHS